MTTLEDLIAGLTHPRWPVRRDAIARLARLGDAAVEPLCRVLETQRDDEARIAAAVDALVACSGGAVEARVLEMAEAADPAIVADAAQILGRRRSIESVPALVGLTSHPDDNVAVGAIEALGRIGSAHAVGALEALVAGGNFFRVFPAIDVLARSGDPRAVPALTRLLNAPHLAMEATRALGRTGDRLALPPLATLLDDVSQARGRVAATAIVNLLARHAERYGDAVELEGWLRAHVKPAMAQRLARAMADARPEEQRPLIVLLGLIGSEAEAGILTSKLGDAALADVAAEALRKLGGLAEDAVLSALRTTPTARRYLVPLVAGRVGATPELVACLDDDDPAVVAAACDGLARAGDATVVGALFAKLSSSNARIAQTALAAIQSLGSLETEALTLAALGSGAPPVRRAALRIAAYFGYAAALDAFVAAAHDAEPRLRDAGIAGLAALDTTAASEILIGLAGATEGPAKAMVARALGTCHAQAQLVATLLACLDDGDPWVRYYACQALGRRKVDATVAIAARLGDDAGQVRIAAIEALASMGTEGALEALERAASSGDPDVRRAALVGLSAVAKERSVPLFLEALRSDEMPTRLIAVSALQGVEDAAVLRALGAAARDTTDLVRNAAIDTLGSGLSSAATGELLEILRAAVAAPSTNEARSELGAVLAALAQPSPSRIAALAGALAQGDETLADLIATSLARMQVPAAIDALIEVLGSAPAPSRRAAAVALGSRPMAAGRVALERARMTDEDADVRRIAALVVG